MKKIKIIAFPRIHVTLVSMTDKGYRMNGGIGFSITDPKILFNIYPSKKFEFKDKRKFPFNFAEIKRLETKVLDVAKKYCFENQIYIEMSGDSRTHYGLGTGTATYLASLEALALLNKHKFNRNTLTKICGRGGTSGIGINTYFTGGGILDFGILRQNSENLGPSSISTKRSSLPLVANKIKLPDWDLGIILPNSIIPKSEQEEISFFQKTCPIELEKVQEILYHTTFGVVCSLLEKNFNLFCQSIKNIQFTAWKDAERKIYNKSISILEQEIYNYGAISVGMSSLGPGIYFFADKLNSIVKLLNKKNGKIFLSRLNNKPRIIEYD